MNTLEHILLTSSLLIMWVYFANVLYGAIKYGENLRAMRDYGQALSELIEKQDKQNNKESK